MSSSEVYDGSSYEDGGGNTPRKLQKCLLQVRNLGILLRVKILPDRIMKIVARFGSKNGGSVLAESDLSTGLPSDGDEMK